ncbi:site-specific integrase [Aeromonas sp. QDB62]|uniref:site-specific integrase n=1 Tax=Aeromonas sp. QDB62 TaxID=2990499 RepID=UPI0022E6D429|nr:phage integrase N-terminal SAM-like domain-containing protein [Aeromonas sp. QDB62]
MTYDKNPQATELDRKTVADALTENLTIKKNQYAQSTFKAYYRKIKQLQTLIGKELLVTVTTTKLELMIAKLLKRYKGNTVNHYLDILRQVFARAKSDGLIALSPMDQGGSTLC